MIQSRWAVTATLVLCLLLGGGFANAKNPMVKQAKEELEFGYKAAKRGYWQEALERFELADELTPNQPRILNNVAVALEANGRFDEARATYETALALEPSNSALKKNFSRFEEFHKTFVAEEDAETDAEKDSDSDPDADPDPAADSNEEAGDAQ